MSLAEAKRDFLQTNLAFTVFVVDKRYSCIRGEEYFELYKNSEHWVSSDELLESRLKKTLKWLLRKSPDIADLVGKVWNPMAIPSNKRALNEIVISLCKLFSATEHVAFSENKLVSPIIIEEGKVTSQNLVQFITLHEKSKDNIKIIVILKDNSFERAKSVFAKCPHGITIKMIPNNGLATFYTVINEGAENVKDFIDAYARQCFSTCSKTSQSILFSSEWEKSSIIKKFSPTIFQVRSTFIKDSKSNAQQTVLQLNQDLRLYQPKTEAETTLKNSFLCMSDLFQVYCYDSGGDRLNEALRLANDLNNDILKAHVYRYSHFFDCSREEKQSFLKIAEQIFTKNDMADHAIYCQNNSLIHQFSQDYISQNAFWELGERARNDTPGLALMAHILNNVGVAYLFNGFLYEAEGELNDGLSYAKLNHIQRLALESNLLIVKAIGRSPFNEDVANDVLNTIFNSPHLNLKRLPYLTAQFALNTIASAYHNDQNIGYDLLNTYDIVNLVQTAFNANIMGTGSMIKQLEVLSVRYKNFNLLAQLRLPPKRTPITGIRCDFICRYGLNPFFFNTWL